MIRNLICCIAPKVVGNFNILFTRLLNGTWSAVDLTTNVFEKFHDVTGML